MCVGGTLQTEAVICGKKPRGLTGKEKNSWATEERACVKEAGKEFEK